MIVSIHQPQYLPWVPYFLKVAQSDVFILLDSVDFQKNGLQNRNLIKTAKGARWLTVPVRHSFGQKICEVRTEDTRDWRRRHWLTLQQAYCKAGAFKLYAEGLEEVFSREWSSLSELDIHLFMLMLRWLDIERPIRLSSEMRCAGKGSELVLSLCIAAGATRYVSGTAGRRYLHEAAFRDTGIEIVYREPQLPCAYPQLHTQAGFMSSLSALDLILNCGPKWREFLPEAASRG